MNRVGSGFSRTWMTTMKKHHIALALAVVLLTGAPAMAQTQRPPAPPAEPEQLGALARANIAKPRPKPPFDLTCCRASR